MAMVGDIWTCRSHGGPGLAGWCRRQVADMISLIRPGRHVPVNHTALEVDGDRLLDAGKRVRLVDADTWREDPHRTVFVHRVEWAAQQKQQLVDEAMKTVGMRYSYLTALGHVVARSLAAWVAAWSQETVICSEVTARAIYRATGMKFRKRRSTQLLEPEQARPRDIFSTVAHDSGLGRPPFRLVRHISHGKKVK